MEKENQDEPIDVDKATGSTKSDKEIVENFVKSITDNLKPLDSDISQVIDDNFWDMIL